MPMTSEVSIYIKRDDLILGPFSEEQTVARYHRGEFKENDLAMIDGMTGWYPLSTYIVDDGPDDASPSFDASAPPQLQEEGEEEEEPAVAAEQEEAGTYLEPVRPRRHDTRIHVNPVAVAWTLLGLGVLAMFLSKWPWLIWLPLLLGAFALGIQQTFERNFASAGPLLAVALLAPWFVWSQWLAPGKPGSTSTETVAKVDPPPATPAPVAATPAPEPEKPKVVEKAAPPEPPPTPELPPAPPILKGSRVALAHDTRLLFEGKDFRLGKEGEEFEVLLTMPDKIYLKTKESRGRVIAVTAPPKEVRLVAPPEPPAPAVNPLPTSLLPAATPVPASPAPATPPNTASAPASTLASP